MEHEWDTQNRTHTCSGTGTNLIMYRQFLCLGTNITNIYVTGKAITWLPPEDEGKLSNLIYGYQSYQGELSYPAKVLAGKNLLSKIVGNGMELKIP